MSAHPIPAAALDDRLAFVGLGGSGKTYNAGVAVERLLERKARVCIIDPLGAWWGLRLSADGKQASPYNIVIFGGPHADIAITETSGALIGETVANMAESCIIDLSEIGSDAAERRFMLAFLTALYKYQSKSLLHLIIDEADMWAPQQIFDKEGGAAQLVGKMQNIVRRGRIKGFIPWLITQRPAVLSWGVLSQVVGIVAFTLTSSQDRDAIGRWVKGQADKERWNQIWGQLAELPVGDGLVWVPRRKLFGIQKFPQKTTFDSSRAPRRGEKRTSRKIQPLDVGALKERLQKVEAEAKANDPTALRSEVAKLKNEKAALERQAAAAAAAKPAPPDKDALKKIEQRAIDQAKKQFAPLRVALEAAMKFIVEINAKDFFKAGGEAVDKEAIKKAILAGMAQVEKLIEARLAGQEKQLAALRSEAQRLAARLKAVVEKAGEDIKIQVDVRHNEPFTVTAALPAPRKRSAGNGAGDGALTATSLETLGALAWWAAIGIAAPTRKQLAAMLGIKPAGSTMRSRLAALSGAGLIAYPSTSTISLTETGQAAAPPPNTAATLIETIRASLTSVERETFDAIPADQQPISREDLGAALNVEPKGSTMRSRLAELSNRELIHYPGGMVARQDWVS